MEKEEQKQEAVDPYQQTNLLAQTGRSLRPADEKQRHRVIFGSFLPHFPP